MFNQYGVIVVIPQRMTKLMQRSLGLQNWIIGESAKLISEYGVEQYGVLCCLRNGRTNND